MTIQIRDLKASGWTSLRQQIERGEDPPVENLVEAFKRPDPRLSDNVQVVLGYAARLLAGEVERRGAPSKPAQQKYYEAWMLVNYVERLRIVFARRYKRRDPFDAAVQRATGKWNSLGWSWTPETTLRKYRAARKLVKNPPRGAVPFPFLYDQLPWARRFIKPR